MKKEFNVLHLLYVCWSIAIVCNIAVYSIENDIYFLHFVLLIDKWYLLC